MQLESGASSIIQLVLLQIAVNMNIDSVWEDTKGAA